jgi:hypothetical protein
MLASRVFTLNSPSRLWLAVVLLSTACRGESTSGGSAPQSSASSKPDKGGAAVPIGTTGLVAEMPQGYKLERKNDTYFGVEPDERNKPLSVGAMFLVKDVSEAMPKSADDIVKNECAPGDDIVKETLAGGGFFVQCISKMTPPGGEYLPNRYVQSVMPAGNKWIRCHWQTTGDIAPSAAICHSLRKP